MGGREISGKLSALKTEAAAELGMTQFMKENNDGYKGHVPAKVSGAQGGPIGGRMVQKMIRSVEDKLSKGMGKLDA